MQTFSRKPRIAFSFMQAISPMLNCVIGIGTGLTGSVFAWAGSECPRMAGDTMGNS